MGTDAGAELGGGTRYRSTPVNPPTRVPHRVFEIGVFVPRAVAGNETPPMNASLAAIFADGIYIGGGVLVVILIILVVLLLMRRGSV